MSKHRNKFFIWLARALNDEHEELHLDPGRASVMSLRDAIERFGLKPTNPVADVRVLFDDDDPGEIQR